MSDTIDLNFTMEDLARMEAEAAGQSQPPETPAPPVAPDAGAPAPPPATPPAPPADPWAALRAAQEHGYDLVPRGSWGAPAPQAPSVELIPNTDIPKPPGYDDMPQEELTAYVSRFEAERLTKAMEARFQAAMSPVESLLEAQASQMLTAAVPEFAREEVRHMIAQAKAENDGRLPARFANVLTDDATRERFMDMAVGRAIRQGKGPAAQGPVGEQSTEVVPGATDLGKFSRQEQKLIKDTQAALAAAGLSATLADAIKTLEDDGQL